MKPIKCLLILGCKKLLAEECMAADNDLMGIFHLSEAVSVSLRTLAVYRDEQLKHANGKLRIAQHCFLSIFYISPQAKSWLHPCSIPSAYKLTFYIYCITDFR